MSPPINSDQQQIRKKTPFDFIFGKVIGVGSFSTVYIAKDIHSNKHYAIKVVDKAHIIREKKTEYVMREKEVLRILGSSCQYFVHLCSTFQDPERLYFVLTYAKNGELLKHIDQHKKFSFECTRFYTAELVLALEFLHSKKIVHRDLKPENILLDHNFHVLITDFGSAKIENDSDDVNNDNNEEKKDENRKRRNSFVGTAQFVSPEMLQQSKSSAASDLWALGCIVYQMATGQMPFTSRSEYIIFQKILKLDYKFPDDIEIDGRIKDFIEKLLVLEPNERLGALDEILYKSIRGHKLFDGVDWDDLGPPPPLSDNVLNSSCSDIIDTANTEPGFDLVKQSRLVLDDLFTCSKAVIINNRKCESEQNITDLSHEEIDRRMELQRNNNIYNVFVDNQLILKQGLLDKRKGLFPRRRMFLLTFGPHLYYVDPITMLYKGEIPWSKDMVVKAKNFKIFFVYTPNRKYHLEDPEGFAPEWVKAIDQVKQYYFPDDKDTI